MSICKDFESKWSLALTTPGFIGLAYFGPAQFSFLLVGWEERRGTSASPVLTVLPEEASPRAGWGASGGTACAAVTACVVGALCLEQAYCGARCLEARPLDVLACKEEGGLS